MNDAEGMNPVPTRTGTRSNGRVANTPTTENASGVEQDVKPRRKKMRTSDSAEKDKGKLVPGGRRRMAGRLANLMKMPLDIFVEIVGHLEPLDLLHLARSNKFMRAILMNKANKTLWRSARAMIEDLPDCPPDLSEPAYASLVFESICTVCGSTRASKIDWSIRVRACKKHIPEATISTNSMFVVLGRNQEDYRIVQSLVPSSMTTGQFRRTEALATIAEYGAIKSKSDPTALVKYIEERKTQVQAVQQHALDIERWRQNRGLEKSRKNRDMIAQRKNSILEKLRELGWDERDLASDGKSFDDWNRMLGQPAALTNTIWNRIRPRLETILQGRKERRLLREREDRKNLRRHEVDVFMTVTANDSVTRGENGKFSRHDWARAFPAGEDLYDLPSVAPFIEADETSVTIDAWTEKEPDIRRDVKIYQMKVRHLLVCKLLGVDSGTHAAQGSQDGEAGTLTALANFDLERLEAEDEGNKEQLAHPAALFLTSPYQKAPYLYPRPQLEKQANVLRAYPAIFTNVIGHQTPPASECLTRIKTSSSIRDASKALVTLLGEDNINEVVRKGPDQDLFRCDACLTVMSTPMTWPQLVRHYVDEKVWFETAHATHIQRQSIFGAGSASSSSSASVGVVDDHTPMRASIVSLEECERMLDVKTQANELDDSKPWWTCKHCNNRSVHDNAFSKKRTKKHEVLLHVRAKHGIAEDDAENHISEERPIGTSWYGLYDDPYDPYGVYDPHDPYDSYDDEFGYDSYDSFGGYDNDDLYDHDYPYDDESEDEDFGGAAPPTGGSLAFGFLAMLANGMSYY